VKPYTLLLPLLLAACGSPLPPITDCQPRGEMRPYCDMQTPEDIAALPDGRHLLLAHFGHMGESAGSLSLFDTRDGAMTPLFPAPGAAQRDPGGVWGDATCREPPGADFSPHGTHLHRLADGRWRYLVVNHGSREAVELFELQMTGPRPALIWRGCVAAAPDTLMNDVVGLRDGGLVYSRMFHPGDLLALPKALLGIATGELWRWHPKDGLTALPATTASYPNGLEISADNRYVFANMYLEREVWRVRLTDGAVDARYAIAHADNSSWGSDGRLWVATHTMSLRDMIGCFRSPEAPCPGSFAIVALDTASGATETLLHHEGPPMGAATVAVPQAGRVYLGSFAGERMVSLPDFDVPAASR